MKALAPLSWIYAAGVSLRNRYYDRVEPKKLGVPVVSVGNLTVGGSGKTPFVEVVSRHFLSRKIPVAVLSRGYGREGSAPFVLVSDGQSVLASARDSGDEPVELARKVDGLVVAVGADRYQAGRTLIERLGPHVLVLDDGFQHRRLHRDLDIVCLDCGDPNLRLLPAGRLREPVANLSRAHAIVLTGYREGCRPPTRFDKPVLRSVTRVVGFSRLDGTDQPQLGADAFRGEPVALAVAVARPERVRESLDADVVLFERRRDHHPWSASELEAIAAGASGKGARALLVTGKDAVKLEEGEAATLPIYRIDIESEILDASALGALLDAVPSLTSLTMLAILAILAILRLTTMFRCIMCGLVFV